MVSVLDVSVSKQSDSDGLETFFGTSRSNDVGHESLKKRTSRSLRTLERLKIQCLDPVSVFRAEFLGFIRQFEKLIILVLSQSCGLMSCEHLCSVQSLLLLHSPMAKMYMG